MVFDVTLERSSLSFYDIGTKDKEERKDLYPDAE